MHERAGAQKEDHLDNAVEQHMGKSSEKSLRSHEQDAEEHVGQVADRRIGKSSLKMPLSKSHSRTEDERKDRRAGADDLLGAAPHELRSVCIPGQADDRVDSGIDDRDRMQKSCDRSRRGRCLRKPVEQRKDRGFCPKPEEAEEEPQKKPLFPAYAAFKDKHSLLFQIVDLVVGAALIAVGARLLVDNGTKIAEALGVPESVIALTFVALGTSLPELVTAITALIKGHGALSLGNVVGANLFNLVLVSGAAITIRPFDIPAETRIFGQNASLVLDVPLSLLVMAILTVPALLRGKLSRWQGILLLAIYLAYTVLQFVLPAIA